LIEDSGGFHHLDHEGGASGGQIVAGADAAEQPVHHADMGAVGGHEGAHLRQDCDQRVLAQERRFARHVRAGHQPHPALLRQIAIVGHEGGMCGMERRVHNRMTAARD